MLLEDVLTDIVKLQDENLHSQQPTVKRDLLDRIDVRLPHALFISGIRRCGKSTLLEQLMQKEGRCNYFNFDDHRAAGFELSDFDRLDHAFGSLHPGTDCYYFDEIQNVSQWERFVRRKLDEKKRLIITGSNASLLSRELGTRLTGRHITYELFPFSYMETLRAKSQSPSVATFAEYIERGGFPEFVKYGSQDILQQLFSDIVNRDIIVRYGLRNAAMVKKIALYLLSNVGNEFTYTGLSKAFEVSSPHSIIDYVSYFEDSYLLFLVPRFSYKYLQQQVNPKKIYGIDTGFIKANTISYTGDDGRLLENAVFLQLRRGRKPDSVFYYKGKSECDFIVVEKNKPRQAIQVCHKLSGDNLDRELRGVKEAMEALKIEKGLILTMGQDDRFDNVDVMPAWKWMSETA
jgi:uncharacterized protein